MAWNEPGGGDRDPWSGKSGNQGPPELDEVVRKLQEKLGGLFGGGRRPRPSPGGGGPGAGGKISLSLGAGVLVLVWIASGIYIVEPAERGVVLRFGAYLEVTQPGPHWHLPYPIEDRVKVNVDQISSFRHKAQMLTADENIVDIEFTVQSRIQDAADVLFQDQNPEKTLKDVTETAVREIIGKSKLDYILTEGRGSIQIDIKDTIQTLLSQYRTGLEVVSVNMQPAKPPEQVKEAFDDAIKAREDKERLENEAQAYSNEILPKARGAAARIVEDAKAYKAKVVAEAQGQADRFVAVMKEYNKAPEVTRERLYLDTMENALAKTNKVLMDTGSGNNILYLPLDRMGESRPSQVPMALPGNLTPPPATTDAVESPAKTQVERGRRVR